MHEGCRGMVFERWKSFDGGAALFGRANDPSQKIGDAGGAMAWHAPPAQTPQG